MVGDAISIGERAGDTLLVFKVIILVGVVTSWVSVKYMVGDEVWLVFDNITALLWRKENGLEDCWDGGAGSLRGNR